jgi:hypothetical protein
MRVILTERYRHVESHPLVLLQMKIPTAKLGASLRVSIPSEDSH